MGLNDGGNSMGFINCRECGKLCAETSSKLCPKCQHRYFDAETTVAEYLREHEHSTIDEVYAATKVEKHIILNMIREGRIIEGNLVYPCQGCGTAIRAGRYCKNCEAEVLDSLTAVELEKKETETRSGIYIKDFYSGLGR